MFNFKSNIYNFNTNINKGIVYDNYTNMYKTPDILLNEMIELINSNKLKTLILKGGRGSGKSTVAIHHTINLLMWDKYKYRTFIFGGWKKEDTKETFNKIETEIKRFKQEIQDCFKINKTTKEILYIPNQTTIIFLPLTDFISGDTKLSTLNRLKAYNNACLWVVDEANFITSAQLDILLRTGRENINALKEELRGLETIQIASDCKLIFLLNPSKPTGDDVVNYFKDRDDGKIIHINIDDLPIEFQSKELLKTKQLDMELVKQGKLEIENYNHTWLGQPQYNLHYQPFYDCLTVDFNLFKDKINNTIFKSIMDISAGGGDNSVLSYGIKVVNDFYIYGVSSSEATVDNKFLNLIKEKQSIFNNPEILYEKNGVGGNISRIFNNEKIRTLSYGQRKNKDSKISSSFKYAKNLYLIKDNTKENNLFIQNIKAFNPSKSKHDDEVDCLSELFTRLMNN